jgi:hypothetical protein
LTPNEDANYFCARRCRRHGPEYNLIADGWGDEDRLLVQSVKKPSLFTWFTKSKLNIEVPQKSTYNKCMLIKKGVPLIPSYIRLLDYFNNWKATNKRGFNAWYKKYADIYEGVYDRAVKEATEKGNLELVEELKAIKSTCGSLKLGL